MDDILAIITLFLLFSMLSHIVMNIIMISKRIYKEN